MNAINTKYSAQQTPEKKTTKSKRMNKKKVIGTIFFLYFIRWDIKIHLSYCLWSEKYACCFAIGMEKITRWKHNNNKCTRILSQDTQETKSLNMNATETMKPDDVGFYTNKKKHFIMKFKAGFNFHLGE